MNTQSPFKRLVLRAVLRNVSPMVIRVLAVPDSLDLRSFDEVFRSILGWEGLGYIFRVHGQEFNSFRRRTKSKQLREFQLRPQESFSTPAVRSTFGNGNCGFWIRKRELPAIRCRFVWRDAVRLLRSIAAAPLGIA